MRNRSGFTLIEILVVIVITVMLFGLLFRPLIVSFNFTRAAQARIQAQDAARLNLARVSRELSDAMFVYDNSAPMTVPAPKGATALVYFARLDFVLPKMIMHCNDPNRHAGYPGVPLDYSRDDLAWPAEVGYEAWPPCPADPSHPVEARSVQPLTPSGHIVRYFVGLRYPEMPYFNRYESYDGMPVEAAGAANTYVLYRAEFSPWDDNLVRVVNGEPDLDDPDFFYDASRAPNGSTYMENWKSISRIVGLIKDVDLIRFEPVGGGNWVAKSSIRFEPTAVQNDPLTPTYLSDTEGEVPNTVPTIYRAAYGMWTPSYTIRIYRNLNDPSLPPAFYYTAPDSTSGHLCLWSGAAMIFDITQYQTNGSFLPADPELAVDVVPRSGEVRFVFSAPTEEIDTAAINSAPGRRITLSTSAMVSNARVVPGSEEVIGPDQTPTAASAGQRVRYARVPLSLGTPGLNQYKIDYETGEMWFASGLNEDLPPGTVYISYKFHNNERDDVVKADYTTKGLLTITFGMRVYDPNSGKTHLMELTDTVHVRNVGR